MGRDEKEFIERMKEYKEKGVSFAAAAKEGILTKLGQDAGEVMVLSLSKAARVDPKYFVEEAARIFGRGAVSLYDPIVKAAETILVRVSQVAPPSVLDILAERIAENGAVEPKGLPWGRVPNFRD